MEIDELVVKIINHIDDTAARTENKIINLMEQRLEETAANMKREVNVLLEQQHSQFNTFGEGLDDLHKQVSKIKNDVANIKTELSDFRVETRIELKELNNKNRYSGRANQRLR